MHQETRKQRETTGRQSMQGCLQHQYWVGCGRVALPAPHQALAGLPAVDRASTKSADCRQVCRRQGVHTHWVHERSSAHSCSLRTMRKSVRGTNRPEQAHTTLGCRRHHTTRNTGTARLHASTRHVRREGCCQHAAITSVVPQTAEGWLRTDCACSRRQQRVGCCMRHTVCCMASTSTSDQTQPMSTGNSNRELKLYLHTGSRINHATHSRRKGTSTRKAAAHTEAPGAQQGRRAWGCLGRTSGCCCCSAGEWLGVLLVLAPSLAGQPAWLVQAWGCCQVDMLQPLLKSPWKAWQLSAALWRGQQRCLLWVQQPAWAVCGLKKT